MVKSILLVAPDSPDRAALVARLEAEGYVLLVAGSRAEALAILRNGVPGAVFIDLSMPRRQGRLVADHLESNPRLRMIPRLVVLGAWRSNTRPVNGCAVFVKPVDPDHVARTLRAVYPPPVVPTVTAVIRRRPAAWEYEIEAALAS